MRYSPNTKIPQRIEFLSITTLGRDDGETSFETRLALENEEYREYLPQENELQAVAFESDYKLGNKLLMDKISSMPRRFAEWTVTEHAIDNELEEGDIIVKDGSLQFSHANEVKCAQEVFKKAEEKGVILTGLSKSCRLTTDTGYSLIASVEKLAKETDINFDEWCYYPIAISLPENDHQAVIMVVKLNRNANTSFRFEILKSQAVKMTEEELLDVVSTVSEYSRDVTIPGYPYGLFDAHTWARVKTEDIENYRVMLDLELAQTGASEDFTARIKAVNMHDMLDEL